MVDCYVSKFVIFNNNCVVTSQSFAMEETEKNCYVSCFVLCVEHHASEKEFTNVCIFVRC